MPIQTTKKDEIKMNDLERPTSHPTSDSSTVLKISSLSAMHQVILFWSLSFVYFLTFCSVALWAPFFPGEAKKRGVSITAVGWIFGIYSVLCVVFSLFYGSFVIPRIGPQKVIFLGVILNAVSYVICGFGGQIQDPVQFVVFFLIVRSIGAIGATACDTAIVVILTQEFSERLPLILGMLEFSVGLGHILGPVFGGGLYMVGGLGGPLFAMAGLMFLSMPILWFSLPKREFTANEDHGERTALLKKIIATPAIIISNLTSIAALISMTFIEPIFQPYLEKKYGLESLGVSLVFLAVAVTFTLASPVAGYILSKTSWYRILIVTGLFGYGTCLLFVGPSPLLSPYLPKQTHLNLVINLMFLGIFMGTFYVPILPEMLLDCQTAGIENSLELQSIVSGLFAGSVYLGAFLGPVVAGVINDHYGFPWTCTIVAFFIAGQGLLDWMFFLFNRRRSSPSYSQLEEQKLLD